jgi:hypothetical protein
MKDYQQFILEFHQTQQTRMVISNTLQKILAQMGEPVAHKLLALHNKKGNFPITYLDVVEDNPKMITFLNAKNVANTKDYWTSSRRQQARIGKVFQRLVTPESPSETEKLVNTYVSSYKEYLKGSFKRFELVKGTDLVYWYNCDHYEASEGGTLRNSCMRTADYLEIYEENPEVVQLLILKAENNEEEIRGRALVWSTEVPENRQFMDRIYYNDDADVELFIKYATKQGWLYLTKQGFGVGNIMDSKNGEVVQKVQVQLKDMEYEHYPYVDTLYYYDQETKILSNGYGPYDHELLGTNGSPSEGEMNREVLRDELMEEDLKYIADTYGVNHIWWAIDDEAFLEEIAEEEAEYFVSEPKEFINSYGYQIHEIVTEQEMEDCLVQNFWGVFYDYYRDEIEVYVTEHFGLKDTSLANLKKVLTAEQQKEMVTKMNMDYCAWWQEDKEELEELKIEILECLGMAEISKKVYLNIYDTAEDWIDNLFGTRNNDFLKPYWDHIRGQKQPNHLLYTIERHLDKKKLVDRIVDNLY